MYGQAWILEANALNVRTYAACVEVGALLNHLSARQLMVPHRGGGIGCGGLVRRRRKAHVRLLGRFFFSWLVLSVAALSWAARRSPYPITALHFCTCRTYSMDRDFYSFVAACDVHEPVSLRMYVVI